MSERNLAGVIEAMALASHQQAAAGQSGGSPPAGVSRRQGPLPEVTLVWPPCVPVGTASSVQVRTEAAGHAIRGMDVCSRQQCHASMPEMSLLAIRAEQVVHEQALPCKPSTACASRSTLECRCACHGSIAPQADASNHVCLGNLQAVCPAVVLCPSGLLAECFTLHDVYM